MRINVNWYKFGVLYFVIFSSSYMINLFFFSHVIYVMLLGYFFLDFKEFYKYKRNIEVIAYLFFVFLAVPIALFSSMIGSGDKIEAKFLFSSILASGAILPIVYFFRKHQFNKHQVLNIMVNIGLVQAICIFLTLMVPDIRKLFAMLLPGGKPLLDVFTKVNGFTNSGAFGLSSAQFFIFLCAFFLLLRFRTWWNILRVLLILSSELFIGRTGLMLSLVVITLSIFIDLRVFLKLIFSCIFLSCIAYLLLLIFNPDFVNRLDVMFGYAFEFIIKGGSSASTDDLKTLYVYPNNLATWVIGDGFRFAPSGGLEYYYMNTDVGYLRNIFATGVFGCLFIYPPVLYLALNVLKKIDKLDKYLVIFMTTSLFILEAKGESIGFSTIGVYYIFLMIVINFYIEDFSV